MSSLIQCLPSASPLPASNQLRTGSCHFSDHCQSQSFHPQPLLLSRSSSCEPAPLQSVSFSRLLMPGQGLSDASLRGGCPKHSDQGLPLVNKPSGAPYCQHFKSPNFSLAGSSPLLALPPLVACTALLSVFSPFPQYFLEMPHTPSSQDPPQVPLQCGDPLQRCLFSEVAARPLGDLRSGEFRCNPISVWLLCWPEGLGSGGILFPWFLPLSICSVYRVILGVRCNQKSPHICLSLCTANTCAYSLQGCLRHSCFQTFFLSLAAGMFPWSQLSVQHHTLVNSFCPHIFTLLCLVLSSLPTSTKKTFQISLPSQLVHPLL